MSRDLNRLRENWESYILRGEFQSDTRGVVKDAWDRCLAHGVDYNDGYGKFISKEELGIKLKKNKNLIAIARPILENVYETIKQTSFSLVLTDAEGVLIYVIESENIHFEHNTLNFVIGARWDENTVGANAIGTALATREAIHMVGSEHFCLSHHPWTCSAALIHDISGQIIGCLDISGSVVEEHIHTLGIVTTAAKIIENQLVLMASYEMMHTAFNAVADGLFVIDRNYAITRVNEKTAELFGVSEEKLLHYNMKEILKDLEITQKVFIAGETLRINDYAMNLDHKKLECLINVSPIQLGNRITGAVVLIKEAQQVRRVVSQIVGFSAGYTFEDIITSDPRMLESIEFSKKIAKTNYTVLLQGESGTGKELFAHAIHNHSSRSHGPFIAINCAALPKDLVESELFGYEKGAFTGAATDGKPGKFELASGGTIFLDEIGELPFEIQSKLLRIFDNQKVIRIGGQYERSLDTRIICATNRNLRDEIEYKTFREDLFFRINVINVTLPPLRNRQGDILLLAEEFLRVLNRESDSLDKVFTPKFLQMLQQHPWKGNVRELKSYIQREFHIADDKYIHGHLEIDFRQPREFPDKDLDLVDFEKELILKALEATRGNVVEAARKLHIGKSTVYRKIKSYNIDVQHFKTL
ncbi:MAG: hypothetical protein AVO33_09120 [delta proteobacterium ML8_F1]|nr:MAG: hypothetical protein AVO33_09120 [delta proteobacterium ML8_F1]